MKTRHVESAGLLLMTNLGVILTSVAVCLNHPRAILLAVITGIMGIVSFVARFRHHRQVGTLQAKGRRKREKIKA